MKWADDAWFTDPGLAGHDRHVASCVRIAGKSIENVQTEMRALDSGSHRWPVSINDGESLPWNCYVVSPQSAYGRYAEFEIAQLGWPWVTWPLQGLVRAMGAWMASQRMDRLVQVNNWLLSTNVYPVDWEGGDLEEMTRWLQAGFPGHAIAWRSLNRRANAVIIDRMKALGYLDIPSRQVYMFDGRAGAAAPFLARHNTRVDAALWRRTAYRVDDGDSLDDAELRRVVELYELLYIRKYTPLNPRFGLAWVKSAVREGWLTLRVLRHPEGRIDGVVGWIGNGQWLTAPIVGYDTSLPASLGLYRLITRLCLQETAARGCRLNFSSGAAHFKRLRGGEPEIEYSMVCVSHLPRHRQRMWHAVRACLQAVAVPLMRRCEL